MLFGQEHVDRYRETGGAEGHDWQGTTCLILTTTGRTSGEPRDAPLIYRQDDDGYVVVASKGGAPEHPALVPEPAWPTLMPRCRFSMTASLRTRGPRTARSVNGCGR